MKELSELSNSELAYRIRLAVRLARTRRGKRRADTAKAGLAFVERLKVTAASDRYNTYFLFIRRRTTGWKNLEILEQELRELNAAGEVEQNGV